MPKTFVDRHFFFVIEICAIVIKILIEIHGLRIAEMLCDKILFPFRTLPYGNSWKQSCKSDGEFLLSPWGNHFCSFLGMMMIWRYEFLFTFVSTATVALSQCVRIESSPFPIPTTRSDLFKQGLTACNSMRVCLSLFRIWHRVEMRILLLKLLHSSFAPFSIIKPLLNLALLPSSPMNL